MANLAEFSADAVPQHLIARTLADIPRFPAWGPMSFEDWHRGCSVVAALHQPLVDLGGAANHIWSDRRWTRIDNVVLISAGGGREAMAIALGGVKSTARHQRLWRRFCSGHALRLLPFESATALAPVLELSGISLGPDRDDAEYVYAAESLARLTAPGLDNHAEDARWLARHGAPVVREGRLRDPWVRAHLSIVYDRWYRTRPAHLAIDRDVRTERAGLFSLPADRRTDHLRVYCLTAFDGPTAFSVIEPGWQRMWFGVVFKYDRSIRGSTAFLRQAVAQRAVGELGHDATLNLAQDAGIAGLRMAKTSWQPAAIIEKWRVITGSQR